MSKRKRDKSKPRRTGKVAADHAELLRLSDIADKAPKGFLEDFPEHARVVAFMIAEWTSLEHKLVLLTMFAMADAAERQALRSMIYAIESSGARLDAMEAALTSLATSEGVETEAVTWMFDEARKLLVQRNKYAHALFGKNRLTGELIKFDPSSDDRTEVPLSDLEYQFGRMKHHSHGIGMIVRRIFVRIEERRKERAEAEGERQRPPDSDAARTDQPPQAPPQSSPESPEAQSFEPPL